MSKRASTYLALTKCSINLKSKWAKIFTVPCLAFKLSHVIKFDISQKFSSEFYLKEEKPTLGTWMAITTFPFWFSSTIKSSVNVQKETRN